jgi:hypothetical protein
VLLLLLLLLLLLGSYLNTPANASAQRIDDKVFSDDFFSSAAFQYGHHDKSISLKAILKHYDTSGQCAVLFDDGVHNEKYADWTGVHFQQVDGDTGVAWSDYSAALKELHKNCECK